MELWGDATTCSDVANSEPVVSGALRPVCVVRDCRHLEVKSRASGLHRRDRGLAYPVKPQGKDSYFDK